MQIYIKKALPNENHYRKAFLLRNTEGGIYFAGRETRFIFEFCLETEPSVPVRCV